MRKRTGNNILIPDDPKKGPPLLVDLLLLILVPPITTIAGLYFLFKRGNYEMRRRQLEDFRHYAAIIGDRPSISIREIAVRLGKTPEEVANGLQTMINENMIDARAYIDRTTMTLHLDGDFIETEFVNPTVNIYVNPQQEQRPEPVAQPAAKPEEKKKAEPPRTAEPQTQAAPKPARKRPAAKPSADAEFFENTLREIRRLNDEIDDDMVSERIDRIGALTASIFRTLREKPERENEVRKFMDYYLPTTLKLLKSYSLMEKQSYQGENIQASRRKIEEVLETLVHAFEQQQDKLFRTDALDVETDISVLETMLASDGLTRQEGGLHL